jgi:hypothetical protein
MPGKKPKKHAVSKVQQRFAGAELARKRAGKATQSGMTEAQLAELASVPRGAKLPEKKKAKT